MSEEWRSYKLKDIANTTWGFVDGPFGSNLPASSYTQEGVPVIRGNNLSLGKEKYKDEGYIFVSRETAEKLKRSKCSKGDIIFTKKGTLGQIGIIPEEAKFSEYLISSNQMKLSVNPEIADKNFVYYLLASEKSINKIRQDSEHTGVPKINLTYLKEFPIQLPDLVTQRHIAQILSSLDEKIELNRQTAQTLEAIAQTIFKEWFVDFNFPGATSEMQESELGEIPKGWRVYKISDLVDSVSITHKFKKPEIIFLNTGDIEEGKILHSKYSSVKGLPGQAKKSIQKLDILFTEIRPANKRYALIDFDAEDYVVSTKLMVLRATADVHPIVVYNFLTNNEILRHLQHLAESRSGTFPQITFNQVKELKLALPEKDLLGKYETVAWSIFTQIKSNEEQTKTLTQLRESLLPKLMKGEINLKILKPLTNEQQQKGITLE
jgi:type I restriction enzyme, S subunit